MAVTPRRRVRAVNLDAPDGPVVPPSEIKAREYWRANKAKNHHATIEKAAYTEANKAFVAENRTRFEMVEGNDTLVVEIGTRPDKNTVSVEKLYALVQSGEITMPKFLSVLSASQDAVTNALGKNTLMAVLVGEPQEPKFVVRKKKDGE